MIMNATIFFSIPKNIQRFKGFGQVTVMSDVGLRLSSVIPNLHEKIKICERKNFKAFYAEKFEQETKFISESDFGVIAQ